MSELIIAYFIISVGFAVYYSANDKYNYDMALRGLSSIIKGLCFPVIVISFVFGFIGEKTELLSWHLSKRWSK